MREFTSLSPWVREAKPIGKLFGWEAWRWGELPIVRASMFSVRRPLVRLSRSVRGQALSEKSLLSTLGVPERSLFVRVRTASLGAAEPRVNRYRFIVVRAARQRQTTRHLPSSRFDLALCVSCRICELSVIRELLLEREAALADASGFSIHCYSLIGRGSRKKRGRRAEVRAGRFRRS
jgi:hypothetical protein